MRLISAKIRLYRILDGGDLMDYIKRTLEQKILDINESTNPPAMLGRME